jgi:DNA-binding MarR family transcriptional regulator
MIQLLAGSPPRGSRSRNSYESAAAFRVALLAFQRRTEEITSRNGLTTQRYVLLLLVRARTDAGEDVTVTSLCEPLQMTQSAVTQLVLGAEQAGLLRRVPNPLDGRSHHLRLTSLGARRLLRSYQQLGEERTRLHQTLSTLEP